jgi:hypothetical protein
VSGIQLQMDANVQLPWQGVKQKCWKYWYNTLLQDVQPLWTMGGRKWIPNFPEEEEHDAHMKLPDDQLPVLGGQEEAASEPPIHSDW